MATAQHRGRLMHGSTQALNALATVAISHNDEDGATERLRVWLLSELPAWNAAVLAGRRSVDEFRAELETRLAGLKSPLDCSVEECRRLLVMLGMAGSSLERHSQETGASAGAALRKLRAGATAYRRYVATLASRAGGPPRDSFLSYVLWNMPAVAVYLPGEQQAGFVLPGAFGSEPPISFSGKLA
jgi:hypothetical protein